jgi:AcrR family transcriptional regulator
MMTRITKDPDVRRRELINCAQNLFYTKGYENTSVRDIVNEVGVAKGTFYYYFDSKLAILEATVEELVEQSLALMEEIVDDKSLSATQKWVLTAQVINNWKSERKEELLAISRALQKEENSLLLFKIKKKGVQLFAPEFARIIAQGIEEGIFDVEFVEEAAEFTMAIQLVMSDTFIDIILNPECHDDPLATAQRKVAAMQYSIERILGATPDSLPLIDTQSLSAWFEDPGEMAR